MKQTDLDEPQIHSRYIRFRKEFPAGFIGPNAVKELCANIMSEQESEAFTPIIFRWGSVKKSVIQRPGQFEVFNPRKYSLI